MKYYSIIIILLITNSVFGQIKDRRAELETNGCSDEISVSPDEKIWLLSRTGSTFFTNNFDSNWHYGKPIFKNDAESDYLNPELQRVSFFNKDTAFLTGYISISKNETKKNGLYLTNDGCKSWKIIDFHGDSWIYSAFVGKNGNAWIGGSSGEIHYSRDFGQHWLKLNSPYNSSSRMNSIFMLDSIQGISGALENYIYLTMDNWKTFKKIATPFDQKKYTNETDYSNDQIEKVILWNSYIVVNQNGFIYYTDTNKIEWKPFSKAIVRFDLDLVSKKVFAVSNDLKIISFSTPADYETISHKSLSTYPKDMKVVDNSVYLMGRKNEIYRVNSKGFTKAIPYTTDKIISKPDLIKQSPNLTWGITDNQIYLSENKGQDWYREIALEFGVKNFKLLNDSVAILWDGVKNNYIYSLYDHIPKLFYPELPIQDFLLFPIKSFSISSGSDGCFHNFHNSVIYEKSNDSIFTTNNYFNNNYGNKKPEKYINQFHEFSLSNILAIINSNPSKTPSIQDFRISEMDKKNYLELVDYNLKNVESSPLNRKKKINKAFYYAIPKILDTLNNSIISNDLDQQERIWSTTSYWFTIQIVNQNNDTINISRKFFVTNQPWNLPWKFEYKGQTFNCYNIEFSKFINSCIPQHFMGKDAFDNKFLLMSIADYLYNQP